MSEEVSGATSQVAAWLLLFPSERRPLYLHPMCCNLHSPLSAGLFNPVDGFWMAVVLVGWLLG